MEWLTEIFTGETFLQAILVISLISAVGIALGSVKIAGVSLGVTFVFFTGILAGHFGVKIDQDMLILMQNFGLVLFIYSLGVQVGPGFMSSFKKGGVKLNMLSTAVLVIGTAMAFGLHLVTGISLPDMIGLLSGAVTNTPMLGAGQQALLQVQPDNIDGANNMALACAVGYPFGVIGVIIAVIVLRAAFGKTARAKSKDESLENAFVAEYHVSNPALFGKTIKEIMSHTPKHFVISRVWKDGRVIIPTSDTVIGMGDHLLVISGKNDVGAIRTIFGAQENVDWNRKDIDWNSIDSQLQSRHILVTKPSLNGVKLGSLKLRNSFGINITRVNRAGIDLLASPSLRLQFGDKLTVVGEAKALDNVAMILGNEVKQLDSPNLFSIFIGLATGLILGSIPFAIPGMAMPLKLGIAGGPIIIGILMGAFGTRIHLSTYTTTSANLMLRQMGLVIYLAALGLGAGENFFETVFRPEGLLWIGISLVLAIVPVLAVGFAATKIFGVDYGSNVGMLCGSMANPIALNYANTTVDGDGPTVSYATVYPLSMFARVIVAQLIIVLCC